VACALALGVVVVTGFNPVASVTQRRYERLDNRVLRNGGEELALTHSGIWLRQSDDHGQPSVIHAASVASGVTLEGVMILFFDQHDRLTSRIDAKEAKLEDAHWRVTQGTRWDPSKGQEPFTTISVPTSMTADKMEQSFAPPETMSFWDLPGFVTLLEQSGFPTQRHWLEYNALLARPFLLAAMVLIAAAFSLRMHRRGGTALMIGAGIGSGFLLYLLSTVVFALGLSTAIPVSIAAWTPPGASWLVGTSLLLYLEDG
jgi:lipopolysaccharide export system permease protein